MIIIIIMGASLPVPQKLPRVAPTRIFLLLWLLLLIRTAEADDVQS